MMTFFKTVHWQSRKYLDWISSQPCCICQRPGPNDPHHYQARGEGIMGGKVSDDKAVPLCHEHHLSVHNNGRNIWLRWLVDPPHIIAKLHEKFFRDFGLLPGKDKI